MRIDPVVENGNGGENGHLPYKRSRNFYLVTKLLIKLLDKRVWERL